MLQTLRASRSPASRALRAEIIRLSWPVVAESLLGTLSQTVDMLLVSPLGAVAVAAAGLSTQPLWLLMGPFIGLGTGLGALIARCVGARNLADARAAARQGFWLALVAALLMSGLIWWQAPAIVTLMGAEPEVVGAASGYLQALAPGLAVLFWELAVAAICRATGDTRTPFYIGLGVNLLNLPLTWALVNGELGLPALGLTGAGIATTIARILGGVAMLAVLLRGTGGIRIEPFARPWLDGGLIRRILRVGMPAAGERIATSLAYVIYTRMVSTLGTMAVAAHYTAVVADSVAWMTGMGLTAAIATLVGQSLGAQEPDRAVAAIREGVKLGALVTVPLALVFGVLPEYYLMLFSQNPEVIAAGAAALRVNGIGVLPMILSLVLIGALSGAGDSRTVAGISLIGGWAVRLGFAVLFLFGTGWGLPGAWAASVLDWTVRTGLLYLRFRSGRWQEIRV